MNELIEMYDEDMKAAREEISKLITQLEFAQALNIEYFSALYGIRCSIEIYGNRKGRIEQIRQELDSVDVFIESYQGD